MSVDTEGLRESLARGATLPAQWYSDPAILRLEQERIFRRYWQYVGRADQVAEPGTWFSCFAGTIPIVVTRDRSASLNAFVNVCRHRGHVIATGEGHRETLQCPYHAWTYGLDGKLRKAPRSERETEFDGETFSLLPVQIDSLGPLLFVNPDPRADPLADALGPLAKHVAAAGVELDRLRFRERREWSIAADWKIAMENYLECYHCPVAHPGFSRMIDVDPDAYLLASEGLVSSQFGAPRAAALQGDGRGAYDARGEVTQAQYHLLWPTTTINIEAGRGNLSVDTTRPNGPGRSVGSTDFFYYEDVPDETAKAMMEFAMQVGREDSGLVEAVQLGLDSGMVPQGRLLLSSEHLIQHFQGLVFEALTSEEEVPTA
jgi:phenylpropionate dioxygenase-like ring-hydroxylating dioxygenase large terminal subunit